MQYVIGSGPAGIACSKALIKRGEKVTMLDAGMNLEKNRQATIDRMKTQTFEEWDKKDITLLKEKSEPTIDGLPKKYVYGSDYTYRGIDTQFPVDMKDCICQPTYAAGGLTSAWGAAIMPYAQEDIESWPIKITDLEPYYEQVLKFVPLATKEDSLSQKFPLYTNKITKLPTSKQAHHMLYNLNLNKIKLEQKNIFFGNSRLAVAAEPPCASCGMCMYGCPYQIIYNSAYSINELLLEEKFTYTPNIIVDKIEEKNRYVVIHAHKLNNGEEISFQAENVFIGAGAFSTTKIMLETFNWENRSVIMKDSQSFLIPMILTKQIMNVPQERLHTLPQIFLEIYQEK